MGKETNSILLVEESLFSSFIWRFGVRNLIIFNKALLESGYGDINKKGSHFGGKLFFF